MTKTVTETLTFCDLGSLIECLEEIRDARSDGNELAIWARDKLLTRLDLVLGEPDSVAGHKCSKPEKKPARSVRQIKQENAA